LVEGSTNVYRTSKSLYPGRVTVYVSGLRQPRNSFSIVDNNTILFKDQNTILNIQDKILIEVRQEFRRKERTFNFESLDHFNIFRNEYDLALDILESRDEILIFINGTFAGLKENLGYIKNEDLNAITITNESYKDIKNKKITLEWR
jgi:hypothetical protein